jgi:hypothetical protein
MLPVTCQGSWAVATVFIADRSPGVIGSCQPSSSDRSKEYVKSDMGAAALVIYDCSMKPPLEMNR